METLRLIKKPVNSTIRLPESFGDGELELIVRPVEVNKDNEKFDPSKFRDALKTGMTA